MTGTLDDMVVRILIVIDEYTRECLATVVARRLGADDVLHCLAELFAHRALLDRIRSGSGTEFITKAVRDRFGPIGMKTPCFEPDNPQENRCKESFNRKLGDELLNRGIF